MIKRFLTVVCIQVILIFLCLDLSAADFNVVNNADSGNGSLRWAMEQAAANGNLEADRIIFHIPGTWPEDRTIVLMTELPALSSNLTIDGSQQAGDAFGVTDAKVRLEVPVISSIARVFYGTGLGAVQIYGISFSGPATNLPAIVLTGCSNITIGAPGKGNHFEYLGMETAAKIGVRAGNLFVETPCENIKISANIIGMRDDGETAMVSVFSFNSTKNLTFGGAAADEGNLGLVHLLVHDGIGVNSAEWSSGRLYFAHNRIGVNFSGTAAVYDRSSTTGNRILGFSVPSVSSLEIVDNQFCGDAYLHVGETNHPFKIARNKFGTDASGTQVLGINSAAVEFVNVYAGGVFGGPVAADANIISGTYTKVADGLKRASVIATNSPGVEVMNNVFRCNNTPRVYDIFGSENYLIKIASRDAAGMRGKAKPFARVDLYYSMSCTFCEPEQLFASVMADAEGNWGYSGALQNQTVIAAATYNGQTSEFTTLRFDYLPKDVIIKTACNGNNGGISGIRFLNALSYGWYDEAGVKISGEIDLLARPGKYQFRIANTDCMLETPFYEISGIDITGDVSGIQIDSTSCDGEDGRIRGIRSNADRFVWYDQNSREVGFDNFLEGKKAGSYTLVAFIGECSRVFGPFVIPRKNGAVIMDDQAGSAAPASCQKADGKITGIRVEGAEKYEWIGADGGVYRLTGSPDLLDAPAGKYRLRASNSSCVRMSREFSVTEPRPPSFSGITFSMVRPCAGKKGSISVFLGNITSSISIMEWRGQDDQLLGHGFKFEPASPGTYLLYLTDVNGCRNLYRSFDLPEAMPIVVDEHALIKTNTKCGAANGGIAGLDISGGTGLLRFTWRNLADEVVGRSKDLSGVTEGTYVLEVSDESQCSRFAGPFVLINEAEPLVAPVLSDVGICAAGPAVIAVQHVMPGRYNLYLDPVGNVPLMQSNSGVFNLTVAAGSVFYVSFSNGTCESSRTRVQVRIEEPDLKLRNVFSPNGDGKNDTWLIPELENYPECRVRIFNRAGVQVFGSMGYQSAFDGKVGGSDLPEGVYYYVIRLREDCLEVSGSLTIVR